MSERRTYTDLQRQDAVGLYERDGLAEAARATSVPKSTIRGWAAAAGVRTCGSEQTRAANEVRALGMEERRQNIAEALFTEVERSLADLDGPVAVYSMGRDGLGTGTAPRPNPKDRQARVVAVAVLLDKALLLTGQATERVDDTGEYDLEADLRAAQARDAELHRLRLVVGSS